MEFTVSSTFAERHDRLDPLSHFRSQFFFPEAGAGESLYFCGNSLGLQPKTARDYVEQELNAWRSLAVDAHFHAERPWYSYHELVTRYFAEIVGAQLNEVVAMNSLTVNLHLLMASFYRPTKERHKILIEKPAFPSDRYAVLSQIAHHGFAGASSLVEAAPRPGEECLRVEDLCQLIEEHGDSLAVVMIGGVNYLTGQLMPMAEITAAGHEVGALVGFDLAHAAGNVSLDLHDWDVDFAAWCTYKYLNSGPGGIAGAFVHERHCTDASLTRFAGWWGHDKENRFRMQPDFSPIPTAEGWQLSNPPILPLATLLASLEVFHAATMPALVGKSRSLTAYLEYMLQETCSQSWEIVSPGAITERGCQLSVRYRGSLSEVKETLLKNGIVCDFREPDIMRVAPVPLYNSFTDVFKLVEVLRRVGGDE